MNLPGINNSHPAIKPYCVETFVASEGGYGFINELILFFLTSHYIKFNL